MCVSLLPFCFRGFFVRNIGTHAFLPLLSHKRRGCCSQNEFRQLTAKLKTLQKNIDQRNRQVEHLENENRAIQFQVGEVDLNLCMFGDVK